MWASLVQALLPLAEAAAVGAVGYIGAHWLPALGISPTETAVIVGVGAKLLPTTVTTKLLPALVPPPKP